MLRILKENSGLITITFIFLLTFLYMLPLRNQAYEDDFAYLQSVRNFISTGELKLSEWSNASFIFQMLWGALFGKTFGFQLKIMHLSTIVLFYISLIFFYLTLRKLKVDNFKSIIFTTVLLSFPWTFQFMYSFLTDVPYMSLLIIASYFYIKGLEDKSLFSYSIGSLFSGFAFLTRQLGIIIPLSFFLVLIYEGLIFKKLKFKDMFFAILPFCIILGFYLLWLSKSNNITIPQYQVTAEFKKGTLPYLIPLKLGQIRATYEIYLEYSRRLVFLFHHLVGFLAPLFLIFSFNIKKTIRFIKIHKKQIIISAFVYSILLFIYIKFGKVSYHKNFPILITSYDNFSKLPWPKTWNYYLTVSVSIILALVASYLTKLFGYFFEERKKLNRKFFNISILVLIIVATIFEFKVFLAMYKPRMDLPPKDKIDLFNRLKIYFSYLFSPYGLDTWNQSWIVVLSYFALLMVIIYIFFKFRLTIKRKINSSYLFLFLIFITQYIFLVLLMYYFWSQYVISLIPPFLILLAYLTKSWVISPTKSFLVLTFLVLFATLTTKNRYEKLGALWEGGTKIVESGVAPIDVDVPSWAWMPWWYYEETLEESVKKTGNKYLIQYRSTWVELKPTSPYTYTYKEVSPDSDPKNTNNFVYDTGFIYSSPFKKVRYIWVKQKRI